MVHVIIVKQIGHGGRVDGWHNSKQQFAGSNPPTAGFFSLKKAHVLVFNCNSSLQRTVCVSWGHAPYGRRVRKTPALNARRARVRGQAS